MEFPIIDNRDDKNIYSELLEKAKEYVPEWNMAEENGDVGVILSKIFSVMFFETIQRYNKIPYKNFLSFINILGADTLPAIAAKGYVTVKMNPGEYEGVPIKRGTRLYTQKEGRDRVIYEIKDDFYAVNTEIEAVYCKNSNGTIIIKSYEKSETAKNKPFCFFDFKNGANLQKYCIVFSEQNVFYAGNGSVITVQLKHKERPFLEKKTAEFLCGIHSKWSYLSSDNKWIEIKKTALFGTSIQLFIEEELDKMVYLGTMSRWISCEMTPEKENVELAFTDVVVSSSADSISPQALYCNDIALVKENFFPFGERFSIYDDFYINCDKAFTQSGALVSIHMNITYEMIMVEEIKIERKIQWKPIMPESAINAPEATAICIKKVLWEYWNGNGWNRLFDDNRYCELFSRDTTEFTELTFLCPADMESTVIGANQGKWIRARILNVSNLFKINKYYNTPMIKNIFISYQYKNIMHPIEKIIVERDLKKEEKILDSTEFIVFQSRQKKNPELYFGLSHTIKGGPVKLYFDSGYFEEKNMPALRWEYYGMQNGVLKWIELKVLDETEFFSKSGLITFICRYGLTKKTLFGRELFWIRAIDINSVYDEKSKKGKIPKLKGMYFNTVPIFQQETMQTEYFYIGEGEVNKLCHLNGENIIECSVRVNEVSALLADEQVHGRFLSDDDTVVVRDGNGMITEYWIQWKRVESFSNCNLDSRVYRLDRKRGKILFGDGKRGKIPFSSDKPTISVDYCVGAGEAGNCEVGEVADFADSVPFIDKVFNLEAVNGGCDVETMEEALQRCSTIIKVQNRAVSIDDYGIIAKQSDRNIVRVKVFSCCNEFLKSVSGHTAIVVLPKAINVSKSYFEEIKKHITAELAKKASIMIVSSQNLHIIEVKYIQFCLSIELTVASYQDYQFVYAEMEQKLHHYFDPIKGNFHGKGFEIGEIPSKTKIYNYIKKINGLNSIEAIYISCFEIAGTYKKEIDYFEALECKTGVPMNGVHEINICVAGQA